MTRQRVLVGSAPGASDLITQYTIATNGDVTSEQSFGGDNQSVGSDSDLCAATLPTQPVYGVDHTWTAGVLTSSQPIKPDGTAMPFKTVDNDVDAFRGLVTTSRDISGLATSYTYDVLGRLRTITPPTDGITEYVYSAATSTAPASVDITQWNHAQMSKLAQSRVRYDGVGRVWREDMLMPDGTWSTRETLYHANGWKLSVSERVADPGSSAVAHKTSYTYDSFGRVTSMTPPDSSSHAIQNSYTGVRLVTRTVPINSGQSSTTTEEYDAQGRLASVTEASAPDGSNVTTTYTYDVGGHLASASTAAPEGTQTRSFAYDHRGFLLSEQQPEKGFNGNGTTSYSQYDARGHVGRRTDGSANGAFDLFFTYDPAERLTKVEDIDQSTLARRTVKEFSFGDTATGSAKARLATAIRHNYPADLGGDASVTESYQYGSDGRVSQRTTTVASTPSFSGATFSFSQTWNELGLPDTVTYPSTASGTSPARSVASTYTNGLLSGVTGYASSISYHANGTIDTVAHSNGMNEQTVADSSDMPRPSQIKVTGGGANWLSGTYAYDGAGNVTQIGTTAYTYDFVGRLQQWSTSGNNASSHSVVYDSFGNMLSDSTSFCAQNPDGSMRCGSSSSVPRQINGTSNHLFAVYDDAGNQLTDGGKRYAYDSSSMMTSASSGGREFRYICTADDERVAAVEIVSGGNHTTWTLRGLGNQLLREWTDDTISGTRTWSWQEDEIWRGTQLLARETPSGVQHYGLDHLGSPRVVTSGSGALVATQDFAPFGIITSSMTGEGALAFTAHERDATNLGGSTPIDLPDYMHARYYAAGLGRFLSVDPISKTAARSPQGWNRYTYSANRPLNFLDPDGRVAVGFAGFSGPNTTSYIYTINKVLRGTPGLGPTNAYSSGDIAKAVAFVAAAYTKNPHQPVVLYGHSWGGSAAVIAAEQLNRMGIPVDLLITFDAVGKYMDFGRGVLLVPPNVKIAINYYQTDPTQLGNNRLEASSELSNVFNIDIGNVKHTDVDDTMGAAAAQLIQSVALNDLFDRMYCFDGDEWLFENSFGTEIQITRTR
jgi:RHS repeat-associated protein